MNIEELLLTWDEYNQKDFSVPYIYEIEKDGKLLIYCGISHTYKPDDKLFPVLQERWDKFLNNSNPNKIGIGEGGTRPLTDTLEEAIIKHGEQGWLKFVANKASVEVVSPDITNFRLWEILLSRYSKEELFYYDILQTGYQWNKTDKSHAFKDYIKQWTPEFEARWPGFDASWENLLIIHRLYSQNKFDPNDFKYFHDQIDPNQKNTVFNKISRDTDIIRDTAVVSEIRTQWDEGKSIFVVFGSGHAIIQEPALKALLK
jgi:hypothetical protein